MNYVFNKCQTEQKAEEQANQTALEATDNIPSTCSQNPELINVWVFTPGTVEQGNYIKPKF